MRGHFIILLFPLRNVYVTPEHYTKKHEGKNLFQFTVYIQSNPVFWSFHYSLVFKVIYFSLIFTVFKDRQQQNYYSMYLSTRHMVCLNSYWLFRIPRNCFITRSGSTRFSQQHAIGPYQGFDDSSHIFTHCFFKINFNTVLSHTSTASVV
jgi:hypothetical protein